MVDAIKVTDLQIRDEKFEVYVNARGMFIATVEDKTHSAYTLEELRQTLMRETKRPHVKVEIPFERLFGRPTKFSVDAGGRKEAYTQRGVAVGIHGGTGNLQVRWEGKAKVEQAERLGWGECSRPLTDEERAEWARVAQAADDADRARRDFIEKHRLDLLKLIREATEKELDKSSAA